VFEPATTRFPGHAWAITEGGGAQRILVGHRHNLHGFVTFRPEFSKGWTGPLRPGTLLAVTDGADRFGILFLHLKAAGGLMDFAVRDHQHEKARSLKRTLDQANDSNLIVCGDFNSVGSEIKFFDPDVTADQEIKRIADMYADGTTMSLRPKSSAATFWNGPGSSDPPSDLDHVVAASQITLAQDANGAEVEVLGWADAADAATWIHDYSDHSLLRFTVTGVQ
jgi:hypothetical protein